MSEAETKCPSCGRTWNTERFNACECGAVIIAQTEGEDKEQDMNALLTQTLKLLERQQKGLYEQIKGLDTQAEAVFKRKHRLRGRIQALAEVIGLLKNLQDGVDDA